MVSVHFISRGHTFGHLLGLTRTDPTLFLLSIRCFKTHSLKGMLGLQFNCSIFYLFIFECVCVFLSLVVFVWCWLFAPSQNFPALLPTLQLPTLALVPSSCSSNPATTEKLRFPVGWWRLRWASFHSGLVQIVQVLIYFLFCPEDRFDFLRGLQNLHHHFLVSHCCLACRWGL